MYCFDLVPYIRASQHSLGFGKLISLPGVDHIDNLDAGSSSPQAQQQVCTHDGETAAMRRTFDFETMRLTEAALRSPTYIV